MFTSVYMRPIEQNRTIITDCGRKPKIFDKWTLNKWENYNMDIIIQVEHILTHNSFTIDIQNDSWLVINILTEQYLSFYNYHRVDTSSSPLGYHPPTSQCFRTDMVYQYLQFLNHVRRVWRYQKGNQNPYIKEQTAQWRTEKVQKDKQRSTKHTYKIKDRETRNPLKIGGELRCSGRVGSSCSTNTRW